MTNAALSGQRLSALVLGLASLVSAPVVAQQTVGLFVNDAPQDGLTLFSPAQSTRTYLLHNDGLLVRTWDSAHKPGSMSYLRTNGNLLRAALHPNLHPNFADAMGGAGGRIEEFDWDGTKLWEFDYNDADHLSHHDIEPLPNGNVLLIAWDYMSEAEAVANGKDPGKVNNRTWIGSVVEVQPTPPVGGVIVWEWHARDHLIQDFDPTKANFGVVADHPELLDFNYGLSARSWNHLNSVSYDPEFDQILVSSRGFQEIWVIDHSTTTAEAAGHTGGTYGKGGDLLYRWGNPQTYRRGTAGDQQLFRQHDALWIPPGRPGAGNITVFNNGTGRPAGDFSTVDEIVPPADPAGNYPTLAPGETWGPAAPVWSYQATPPTSFYASNRSGAERQPNGNTLICDANPGRFFEVEPDGTVTWEYVNPVGFSGPAPQGGTPDNSGVFKVRRYPPGFPGFAGRDLTPGDPIETFTSPLPPPAGSLRASRVADDGSSIDVTWDAFLCPSFDYNLLYGDLQNVGTYALAGAQCGIGITGGHLWSGVPPTDLFFLVVGTDDTAVYESSWGRDTSGNERFATKASFLCGATTKVVSATCP